MKAYVQDSTQVVIQTLLMLSCKVDSFVKLIMLRSVMDDKMGKTYFWR